MQIAAHKQACYGTAQFKLDNCTHVLVQSLEKFVTEHDPWHAFGPRDELYTREMRSSVRSLLYSQAIMLRVKQHMCSLSMYNQGTRYNTIYYLIKQITIMCMPRLHNTLQQSTCVNANICRQYCIFKRWIKQGLLLIALYTTEAERLLSRFFFILVTRL